MEKETTDNLKINKTTFTFEGDKVEITRHDQPVTQVPLKDIQQMAQEKKDWEQNAVKHPGSFTAFAKSKGQTVEEATHDKNLSPHREKQAILARTFERMAAHKHEHK